MPTVTTALLSGFLTGAALIVAIGAQNMFVLRQGLQGRHVVPIVLFCALADTILVSAGVAGLGTVLLVAPGLTTVLTLGGAVFLLVYGLMALRRACGRETLVVQGPATTSLGRTLATTAAFTLLNPHVYLDTVLLMGAAGTRFAPPLRPVFVAGAALASFSWFTLLGFGARALTPVFARPGTWRLLDAAVGATMLALAAGLVAGLGGAP